MRLAILLLCGAVACGGGSTFRPKLVQIEDTFSSTGNVAIQRTDFTYEGDELRSIVRTEETEQLGAWFFFYTDGWLDTVEVENAVGEFVTAHHFRYRDGRVSRIERRDAVFFADPTQPPGERRRVAEITYGRYGVSAVDFSLSALQDPNTETFEVWQERYRYDDGGRLERITSERPGGVSIHDLTYEEESGLLNMFQTRLGGITVSTRFAYEDTGRLDRVTQENDYYVFEYDGDRVQEIIYTSTDLAGTATQTTRYSYGDGSTRGITPIPGVPHGDLFDLKGFAVEELDFATFAALQ